jgi:hypothetical protein
VAHIFISYAREDQRQAKGLADVLSSEGLDVWWDPELYIGQNYPKEIQKVISESQHVIVLWSRHSVDSEWVRREATMGRNRSKLLPVRLDDCELPRGFQNLHTVQFAGWAPLLEELYRTIGGGAFFMPSSAVHRPAPSAPAQSAPPMREEQEWAAPPVRSSNRPMRYLVGVGLAAIAALAFWYFLKF